MSGQRLGPVRSAFVARLGAAAVSVGVALLGAGCGPSGPSPDGTGIGVAGSGGLAPIVSFYAIAALIIGGALLTILSRNTVSAVMSLVATFFALAAMYTLLSAHFLAAIQVLVYAGAIMTLFVFVVMVLNREEVDIAARRGLVGKAVGIGAAVAGMVWLSGFFLGEIPADSSLPPPGWGGMQNVGEIIFRDYLFPFEAVSILLLIAVIAAVVLARIPKRPLHHADVVIAPTQVEPATTPNPTPVTDGAHR